MSSSAERIPLYYAYDEYVKNGFFHTHPAKVLAGLMVKTRFVDGQRETALFLGSAESEQSLLLRTPHTLLDSPSYIYAGNEREDNRVAISREIEKDGSVIYEYDERKNGGGLFDYSLLHYERVLSESSDTWQALAQKARAKMETAKAKIADYFATCKSPFAPEHYAIDVDDDPSPWTCDYLQEEIEASTSVKMDGEHYADVYAGRATLSASATASKAIMFPGAAEGAVVKATVRISGSGHARDAAREDGGSPARVAHTIRPILRIFTLPGDWENLYPEKGSPHALHCDIPLNPIAVPAKPYNQLSYGTTILYETFEQTIEFTVPASRFIRFALMIDSDNPLTAVNNHLLDGVGPYAGHGRYENNVDSYFTSNLYADITILATDIGHPRQ
jgi:hypothetical protein